MICTFRCSYMERVSVCLTKWNIAEFKRQKPFYAIIKSGMCKCLVSESVPSWGDMLLSTCLSVRNGPFKLCTRTSFHILKGNEWVFLHAYL